MAKAKKREDNLALKIPVRSESITWDADEDGIVTIHVENKGIICVVCRPTCESRGPIRGSGCAVL